MNKALVSIGVLCGVTAVAGTVLGRVPEQALADATMPAQVQIKSSCAMSSVTNTNEGHVATIDPGAYKTDIGKTTLTVACNDSNGWAIYAVGYGEDSKGETRLKAIGEDGNPYYIATGTATSGGTSNWAMKLMAGQGTVASAIVTAYQSYHAVPSAYDKVAALASNTSPAGEKVQTTYAVYAASGQMAGTYNGKVKYTLLHPSSETPCAGSGCVVNFNANSGTAGSLTSVTQEADRYFDLDDYFETAGTLPTRSGYNFKGFAKTNNATQPNYAYDERNGLFYPSVHYVAGSSAETLYAVWEKIVFDCRKTDMPHIQNVDKSLFTTEGAQIQLCDERDGKAYWTAKLADGNIWMTQNLDLDLTGGRELSSSDTDVTNTITLTPSVWSVTAPNYKDGGDYYIASGSTGTKTSTENLAYNAEEWHYHLGSYYTWTAALAIADSTAYTTNYSNPVSTSICPAGWRLPKGFNGSSSANGDFRNLNIAYGNITNSDATLRAAPLYFARSGRVSGGSLNYVGTYGNYWSSTVYNSDNAYFLDFQGTGVYPMYNGRRVVGLSVRCLAR